MSESNVEPSPLAPPPTPIPKYQNEGAVCMDESVRYNYGHGAFVRDRRSLHLSDAAEAAIIAKRKELRKLLPQ